MGKPVDKTAILTWVKSEHLEMLERIAHGNGWNRSEAMRQAIAFTAKHARLTNGLELNDCMKMKEGAPEESALLEFTA
jgi:hypothetical protein